MKNIKISDATMKQTKEGFALSFKEKIELSKLLDKLGVDRSLTRAGRAGHDDDKTALILFHQASSSSNSSSALSLLSPSRRLAMVSV